MTLLSGAAGAQEQEPDDFELLQEIRRQYREGNYSAVEGLAARIFESEPSMLVRAETHQFLGASLELLGRSADAEEQFEELLTLQPQFIMDQAEFPTEVITLFETVRLRVQDRFRQIEERRRRAQEAERRERERRAREEQERLRQLSRPRYLVSEVRERHLIVAFLPFGAGQFQNGQRGKGYGFLGTELALTAASMLFWLLGSTMQDNLEDNSQGAELYQGYQITSYCVYGTLAAVVIAGIIDALVGHYRSPRSRWREVEEDEVPQEHRIDPNFPETEERGNAAEPE